MRLHCIASLEIRQFDPHLISVSSYHLQVELAWNAPLCPSCPFAVYTETLSQSTKYHPASK